MYNKIKSFLNLLGDNYYVFGGMALSQILLDVKSNDWDIVINSAISIQEIMSLLNSIFNQVNCEKLSFILNRTGYSGIIYQCKEKGKREELFDFKFENIKNKPIVKIDGINYLDIQELYTNLVESIKDSEYLLYEYETNVRKLSPVYIKGLIDLRANEMKEFILDPDNDQDEIDDYKKELANILSKEYYNEIVEGLQLNLDMSKNDKIMAEKLLIKNSERIKKLLHAVNNVKFKPDYIRTLINDCVSTNNQITKTVGNLILSCNNIMNSDLMEF